MPNDDFTLDLEKSEVIREGTDITMIGYGNLMRTLSATANRLEKEGISCEIIDLQTIYPYDAETLIKSVKKTGRCIITHEAPLTAGIGGELSAKIQ